jgi:hypothetical protein
LLLVPCPFSYYLVLMNTWTKSLLTGCIVAAITYTVLFQPWRSAPAVYDGEYRLRLTRFDTTMSAAKALVHTKNILKLRLDVAQLEYTFTFNEPAANEDPIYLGVSIKNMKDTTITQRMLFTTGMLQFREVYLPEETPIFIATIDKVAKQKQTQTQQVAATPKPERDSMHPDVKALLDTLEQINPVQQMTNEGLNRLVSGNVVGTSWYFLVKVKDTAELGEIARTTEVMQSAPADARYCYGSAMPLKPRDPESESVYPFYLIKTRNRQMSVINSSHVADAKQSYSVDEKPNVVVDLTARGAREFQQMTKDNTGRPIAMMFDNIVISAPFVQSEIPGGQIQISGDFTKTQAEDMANMFKSGPPASRIETVSSKITPGSAPNTGGGGKKWLYVALSFVIGSGLSFFVFKSLKST